MSKKCTWICQEEPGYRGGWYSTGCGCDHIFFEGHTLDYADIKYCPYCGLEVEEEERADAGGDDA